MELLVLLTVLSASSCRWDLRELLRCCREGGREGDISIEGGRVKWVYAWMDGGSQ